MTIISMLRIFLRVCQLHRNSTKCLYSCGSTSTLCLKHFCEYLVLYRAGPLCVRRSWVHLSLTFYIFVYFVAGGGADVYFSQHSIYLYIFIYCYIFAYIVLGGGSVYLSPAFQPLHSTGSDSPFAATQSLLITFFFSGCHFLKSVDWNSCFILRIFKVSRKMNLYCVQKHLL